MAPWSSPLILWVALISPQNSKLTSPPGPGRSTADPGELAPGHADRTSQSEGQKLSSNCADLQKISTQIPSVQTPTDIDAEESSFESQFNALAASSGVTLAQFSGFAPASSTAAGTAAATSTTGTAAGSTSAATAGVTAVPTTLTVQGNYGQITSFINGLDSFPRLFVIQKFILAYGIASTSSTSGVVVGRRVHRARRRQRDAPPLVGRRCGSAVLPPRPAPDPTT